MREARQQTTMLIWAIRLAAVALLAILIGIKAAEAQAGIGFEYAKSSSRQVFSGSGVAFQFELKGSKPRDLDVQVIRKGAGLVTSIPSTDLPAGAPLAVDWSGLNANAKPAKPGAYVFKVRNPKTGKVARMKRVRGKRNFTVKGGAFPVRGPYSFGSSGARFGAGRTGHSHQGQDVIASCGVPLVAPERGQVVARNFQSSAGNYVVVKLAASGHDAVFMHLQKPSWATVGTKVFPGQQIGKVGDTGNAQGCHLHFEMWSPPGWYTGGAPYDPLPTLKNWAKR